MSSTCTLTVLTGKTFVASFERRDEFNVVIPFLATDSINTVLYEQDGVTVLREIPSLITNKEEGRWQIRLESSDTTNLKETCSVGSYVSLPFVSTLLSVPSIETPLISDGVLLIYPGLI